MTHTTELERLAHANPVPEAPQTDAEAQLRAIVATPRADSAPRWRAPRRLVPALALSCALAAALVAASATGPGGPAPTLVERAYAQVTADDAVVHEVVVSSWTVDGKLRGRERVESWYRPSTGQAHKKITGDEGAVEVVVTQEGGVLVASADVARLTRRTGLQPMASDNPIREAFRARNRRDEAATFREAVDTGTVSDRGRATFDGRPAQRFEVTGELDGIDAFDWYVDPVSGHPLGAIERIGEQVRTERLERYEKLAPTAAALAALGP